MYKVSRGKLWMDGSGRVSVPVAFDTDKGPRSAKLLVCPEDKVPEVCDKFAVMARSPEWLKGWWQESLKLSEELAHEVLQVADEARKCPRQLKELALAQKRTVKGAEKSRVALQKRILNKKEIAFKKTVQDMLQRGSTKNELFQLVREAIVEGVMEK